MGAFVRFPFAHHEGKWRSTDFEGSEPPHAWLSKDLGEEGHPTQTCRPRNASIMFRGQPKRLPPKQKELCYDDSPECRLDNLPSGLACMPVRSGMHGPRPTEPPGGARNDEAASLRQEETGRVSSDPRPSPRDPGWPGFGRSSEVDSRVDSARLRQGNEIWDTLPEAERQQAIADFMRLVTPHIEEALLANEAELAQDGRSSASGHPWGSSGSEAFQGYRSGDLWVSPGSAPVSPISDTSTADQDQDRLSDALEEGLAIGFNPMYHPALFTSGLEAR